MLPDLPLTGFDLLFSLGPRQRLLGDLALSCFISAGICLTFSRWRTILMYDDNEMKKAACLCLALSAPLQV